MKYLCLVYGDEAVRRILPARASNRRRTIEGGAHNNEKQGWPFQA